jgi:hypothetical protein
MFTRPLRVALWEKAQKMGSMRDLLKKRLPLNRKEVYFTATVLPAIICANDFAHFDRFLKLLGAPESDIQDARSTSTNVQFFTEYCLADAIHGDETKSRFPHAPTSHERPDLMILIDGSEPLLIAVEAKLYDGTREADLNDEMNRQKKNVLDYLGTCWPGLRTIHAALLPKPMKDGFTGQTLLEHAEPSASYARRIITWEEIQDKYADVSGVSYFLEMLRIAIKKYPDLLGGSVDGNEDARLPGSEIVRRYEQGDSEFQTMGRNRGIDGPELGGDIATGAWSNQVYQVRKSAEVPNRNWFRIGDFVVRVRAVEISNLKAVAAKVAELDINVLCDELHALLVTYEPRRIH